MRGAIGPRRGMKIHEELSLRFFVPLRDYVSFANYALGVFNNHCDAPVTRFIASGDNSLA